VTALLLGAALCACERASEPAGARVAGPEMGAPAPESAPGRRYVPVSETARAITGRLTVTLTTRMPDAQAEEATPTEVLSLRAETGVAAEAALEGSLAPSISVEGQTIRALMELPVEASRVLVYRVTEENAPAGAQKLCGARQTTRVLVWEPETPGDESLRLLTLAGDAPGRPGAQLCMPLAYERDEAR
jgi:pyruvate/2-oxoglutarate dehydrogenase complex dihydrolipoamide acyltransferase (E2) component